MKLLYSVARQRMQTAGVAVVVAKKRLEAEGYIWNEGKYDCFLDNI